MAPDCFSERLNYLSVGMELPLHSTRYSSALAADQDTKKEGAAELLNSHDWTHVARADRDALMAKHYQDTGTTMTRPLRILLLVPLFAFFGASTRGTDIGCKAIERTFPHSSAFSARAANEEVTLRGRPAKSLVGVRASILTVALLLMTITGAPVMAHDTQARPCPAPPKSPTFKQAQVGIRTARDHGFLWRIKKDGRNSYLYGTFHIAKQLWMYPGKTVQSALTASDRVALELDPLDADIAQRLKKAKAVSESDPSLPAPLAARMRADAELACFSLPVFSSMFSEAQLMTLESLASRSDGLYPDFGSEWFLSGFARGLHKPVVSLETPELQMQALRIENQQDRNTIVEKWLGQLESNRTRALQLRMSEVWADSRVDELHRFIEWCECADTEAERRYWRRLIDDRNGSLADSIVSMLDSGQTVFAAVGSLHMIGPAGLPKLLAQQGYLIEFLPFSFSK